jgi:3-methyladenine DNA glycosylase/8-oxoguanine DNA glycosylase
MRLAFDCEPLDLALTLRPLQHGRYDPTLRLTRTEAWRATRTPEGPATQHIRVLAGRVEVEAWGPGAGWALATAPDLVGSSDRPEDFEPPDERVREAHRRNPGLRIPRSSAVVEVLLPTILEQKVTGAGARRSYRALIQAFGERAPGPFELHLQPAPKVLASLGYEEFHPLGVERKRATTIKVACSYAHRLEETTSMPLEAARKRLLALPGIGEWTTALVAGAAWGDPDAVEVGDYHLPNIVSWFLAGEPRANDERMLELLEPFSGQRGRVLRLIEAAGARPPRYGPRLEVADISRM